MYQRRATVTSPSTVKHELTSLNKHDLGTPGNDNCHWIYSFLEFVGTHLTIPSPKETDPILQERSLSLLDQTDCSPRLVKLGLIDGSCSAVP
jgi:hypothetical protein